MILTKRRFSLFRMVVLGAMLILLLSITSIPTSAEPSSTAFVEPFDDASQFTTSEPFFADTFGDFFGISDGVGGGDFGGAPAPGGVKAYTGFTGNFLTGMDLNGEGAALPIVVDWTGIDVSGLASLEFSGDFAEFFDDPGDIDATDYILVEYQLDGGGYQTLLSFRLDENEPDDFNGIFREDTDLDGRGDGVALGNAALTFTKTIAGTGSTLDLRLSLLVESGDEDFGADNFIIREGTSGPADPVINEFVFNHTGSDTNAFIEVFGSPSTDYSAFTVLEIEGDSSGAGVIDAVLPVGTTDAGGFWLDDEDAENGTVTLLLVEGFSGAKGDDLDTDNDGAFDSTPWTRIVDDVAATDGGGSDRAYSSSVLGPYFDGNPFGAGGASRIPNGTDTDTAADWVRNDFDGYGFPGFVGSQQIGEAINTPGAVNEVITVIVDPFGVCGDPATYIHDIQGSGLASTDVGNIRAVEAVVVATFYDSNEIGGYFLQEEDSDADGDPLTSEGLRVFETSNTPAVGDLVRIRGSVSEFFGLTELNNVIDFAACGTGVATAAQVNLPVGSIDDFEAYEGMLVTFPQTLYIAEYFNFDRYGEIVLSTDRQFQPTSVFEPGSVDAANLAAANALSRIKLDDGRGNQNPDPAYHPNGGIFDLGNLFRGGDTLDNVTGVLDFNFGEYKVQLTQGANYANANPRTVSPDPVGGNVTVASFNVLNYFTTLDNGGCPYTGGCRGADNADEFTRQRDKIIAAIAAIDADVVGLIEIENHPGDVPVADLVSGLNDMMGAGTYDYVATGAIGTDAIRQAFIYKPATVSLMGDFAVLDDPAFTDPLGYGEAKSRPALAQSFIDNSTGSVFTAVVNHLKSKGSECGSGDDDPEAGSCNLTRTLGAQALVDWLATDPTGSHDEDFLIIGDLNAYDKEDPIDVLTAGGYSDQVYLYLGENAYSYVFDGQLGYLDHGLANAALEAKVSGLTIWHINADEADLIDYDTSFKRPNQDAIYAPDAYRSSDHDPVVVGLELTTEDEIFEMMGVVEGLVEEGLLNNGQGKSLLSKLENILAKLGEGKIKPAVNQLGAFINELEDFVDEGVLAFEDAEPLLISAEVIVTALGD